MLRACTNNVKCMHISTCAHIVDCIILGIYTDIFVLYLHMN